MDGTGWKFDRYVGNGVKVQFESSVVNMLMDSVSRNLQGM